MSLVAVDIGATNIRVAVGDVGGILAKRSEATDRLNGPEGIPRQIARMVRGLGCEPSAIGVGSIGPLDVRRGAIGETPNFVFKHIPVVGPLASEFGVPVEIVNDCNAAVIGEHAYGAGRGVENLFYVTLSTGLGGGAIVDGHPLGGKDGNAPEIGHITLDLDSELVCGCGCRGHWEAYCSGANIPNYARLLLRGRNLRGSKLMEMVGGDLGGLTSEAVFEAAKMGDENAILVVEAVGRANAVGFADIVNAFDPELITIGGSVALNNPDMILGPILAGIDAHLINRRPEIMITPLGADVVLYGGLAIAERLAKGRRG
ncbi:MAG: ROK family protein [Candidatus Bathyarchaeota archaeon]|nr:ROK family protein [Candidatus Bathyarchaeota archaeon]